MNLRGRYANLHKGIRRTKLSARHTIEYKNQRPVRFLVIVRVLFIILPQPPSPWSSLSSLSASLLPREPL